MLEPDDHRRAVRTMGLCLELVYLDDYWTRAASEGMVSSSESLKAIIDAMDQGFAELADGLSSLTALLKAHDHMMRTMFEAAVTGSPLPGAGRVEAAPLSAKQRERAKEIVERRGEGDFATAVASAVKDLGGRIGSEREQLRAEFERVARGSKSAGDMSAETLADVLLVAAGTSALLGPEAGGIVLAAAGLWDLIFG